MLEMNCPICKKLTRTDTAYKDQAYPYIFKKCEPCSFFNAWNIQAKAWFRTKKERRFLDPDNPRFKS